jgi:hypothetical protein
MLFSSLFGPGAFTIEGLMPNLVPTGGIPSGKEISPLGNSGVGFAPLPRFLIEVDPRSIIANYFNLAGKFSCAILSKRHRMKTNYFSD